MRSKTSFFNKTVFWSDLRRYWPLTAGYTLLWLMLLPLSRLVELDHNRVLSAWNMQYDVLDIAASTGYWVALFTGILFAMAAFSYLTNPRATNGLHALPARRETLYGTHYLAGLCAQLAPQLCAIVLTAAVLASHRAFDLRAGWLSLLALALPTLFFYSFGVFCMMFTGQILAAPVFYGVLNVLAVGVEALVRLFAGNFLYGWSESRSPLLSAFSPIVKLVQVNVRAWTNAHTHIPDDRGVTYPFEEVRMLLQGLDWLLIYAAVGLVLAALGLLVYRRRHSEATGGTVAVGWARPIFKYGVALCTALALGQLIYWMFFGRYRENGDYSLPGTIVCMAAAGLVGYFLAEMLLKKSFRVFKTGWKGAAAVAAALVLLGVVMSLDLTGYEGYVPDASQILRADVNWSGYTGDSFSARVADDETLRLVADAHRAVAGDKQRQLSAAADNDVFGEPDSAKRVCRGYFEVAYTLKNGRVLIRRYSGIFLWADELNDPASPASAMTALYNAPNVKMQSIMDRGIMRDYDQWSTDPRALPDLRFTGGYYNQTLWSENGTYLGQQEYSLTAAEAEKVYGAILSDVAAGHVSDTLFGYEHSLSGGGLELSVTYRGFASPLDSAPSPYEKDRRSWTFAPRLTEQMTDTLAALREMGVEPSFD